MQLVFILAEVQGFRPFPIQELREMGGYFSKLSWEGTGSLPKFWGQFNKSLGPTQK